VTTLVFGAPALEHLFVGGQQVVAGGELLTADPAELAAAAGQSQCRDRRVLVMTEG